MNRSELLFFGLMAVLIWISLVILILLVLRFNKRNETKIVKDFMGEDDE